jgi:hypothetical protein
MLYYSLLAFLVQNKAQQCQIGIQVCSFLKNKILGSAQMNNASLHDTSLINSSDREVWCNVRFSTFLFLVIHITLQIALIAAVASL